MFSDRIRTFCIKYLITIRRCNKQHKYKTIYPIQGMDATRCCFETVFLILVIIDAFYGAKFTSLFAPKRLALEDTSQTHTQDFITRPSP
ncbi:hypothetical protein CEXT_732721 [Caerostris extrusa]|uniref:Uncharacterized protein n=1 Tax=Caerostris extrusa TaxID=172846 RepID=A0AAV4QX01_CAEEX|nr:hypothetical protein CEXT_732721 [Caerostris extrusa]